MKELIDKLVGNPEATLAGLGEKNEAIWGTRKPLESVPITEQRAIWENVAEGQTTDDIIIQILKKNPGVELQLYNHNGFFPYIAIYLNGCEKDKMSLPKGVAIYADAFWLDWSEKSANICLAEILT